MPALYGYSFNISSYPRESDPFHLFVCLGIDGSEGVRQLFLGAAKVGTDAVYLVTGLHRPAGQVIDDPLKFLSSYLELIRDKLP